MNRIIVIVIWSLLIGVSCKQTKEITLGVNRESKVLSEADNFDFQYAFVEANKQMMLGNYEMAKNFFLKCLKIDPNDPAVHYKLATIYLFEKNVDEALIYAKIAYDIHKENEWYAILLATIFEQLEEVDKAIEIYTELKNIHSDNPQYYIELAILNQNSKRYEEAIKIYNETEIAFGMAEPISLEKERIYTALGNFDKAKAEIEKLSEYFPDDTRYIGVLADYYMQQKEYEEAKKLYDKILIIEPDNGIVRISLASYYYEKGDYNESYKNLEMAFQSKNVESAVKTNLILSMLEGKNRIKISDQQIENLTKIIVEKHPDDFNARLIYIDILLQKQEFEKAKEELILVSKSVKDKYILWEQLLLVHNQLLDFEGMYTTSKQAIEYFPNQSVLYLFNGIAANQIKKYDEAIESLKFGEKLVTTTDPQKIQFYIYLGESLYNTNKSQEAFSYFDKILQLEPDNVMVLNNYAYYLSEVEQELDKAKEMSLKTVETEPDNATYLDTYAWILYKMKDFENAKIYIEKALQNGGITNSTLMDHYGDILYEMGNLKEAKETWNRAYELGNDNKILEKINKLK